MSSILNYRILLASIFAIAVGTATASAHPLVNPGFDVPPIPPGLPAILPGAVGNFGLVVGPPFDDGFWGAENSSIVATGSGVTPLSASYMLEMMDDGLAHTQAWQVVNVAGDLPLNPYVGLSAWFTVSNNGSGSVAGVQMRTFATGAVWPTSSGIWGTSSTLDGASNTWEKISLAPVPILANTEWILAEVFYVNATLRQAGAVTLNGYVDDVKLTIGVPEPASLSLMGLGLGLALLRRRRM